MSEVPCVCEEGSTHQRSVLPLLGGGCSLHHWEREPRVHQRCTGQCTGSHPPPHAMDVLEQRPQLPAVGNAGAGHGPRGGVACQAFWGYTTTSTHIFSVIAAIKTECVSSWCTPGTPPGGLGVHRHMKTHVQCCRALWLPLWVSLAAASVYQQLPVTFMQHPLQL